MAKKYLNDTDNIEFGKSTAFQSSAIISPPALIADVNDFNPTGFQDASGNIIVSVLRMLTDDLGNKRITGILAPLTPIAAVITIQNIGTVDNLSIRNNDALSVAGNRFLLNANANLAPNESATFIYDTTDLRWRHLNDYK